MMARRFITLTSILSPKGGGRKKPPPPPHNGGGGGGGGGPQAHALGLVSSDVALMLIEGLGEGVAARAIVAGDEVEVSRLLGPDHGGDRLDARVGDRSGRPG